MTEDDTRDETRDAAALAAFDRALDMDDAERNAWVAGLGGLRGEVEALLRSHREMEPSFLRATAAERAAAASLLPEPGACVGRYRLESVVGTGGSGTVFAARQAEPDRLVAVKVLHDALASDSDIDRFREEAATLARLSHPDIAHVYDAGIHDGLPWIAMELVADARPVTEYAAGLDPETRVGLIARACDALAHAHGRGIVHRDVKPANVLVDAAGRMRIVDFGIATHGASRAEAAGTPGWMSPEQARGEPADARSDVYGLGAVLHEMLAGRPPVDVSGMSLERALAAVASAEPPQAAAEADLDAVRRRALANRREDRYASAAEFGEDLRRWLGRFPVRARPATSAHAAALFIRRRPGLSAALGGAVLALAAGTAVSAWFAVTAAEERRDAVAAREAAVRQAYVAEITAASAAIELRDVATARLALDRAPEVHRGFEWRHLAARLDESAAAATDEGFRPFAATVAKDADGRAVVAALGSRRGMPVMSAPDGRGENGWLPAVRLYDAAASRGDLAPGRDVPVRGAEHLTAFACDVASDFLVGRRDGSVAVMTWRSPTERTALHDGPVNVLAVRGRRFASGGWDGRIVVSSMDAPESSVRFEAHGDRVVGLRFSPDGTVLASGGRDGLVRLWNPGTGALIREFAGHESGVEDVAFSPDGLRIASVSRDMTLRIRDVSGERPATIRTAHSDNVRAVAWSPDGKRIATASYDRTVGLWDAREGHLLRRFAGHDSPVRSVAFLGERIVSAAQDGVRIWDARVASATSGALPCRDRKFSSLSLSPDGGRALLGGADGRATLVSLRNGAELWTADIGVRTPIRASLLPADADATVVANNGAVRILDSRTGAPTQEARSGRNAVAAAFLPHTTEPRTLVVAGDDGIAWQSWPDLRVVAEHAWPQPMRSRSGAAVAGSSRGDVLACNADGEWVLGAPDAGRPLVRPKSAVSAATACEFSPDGRTAAWAFGDGVLVLAGAADGEVRRQSRVHRAQVRSIRWSPDGSRIVTAADDRTVRVLDADSAAELLVLRTPWAACDARFTDDGTALVALALEAVDAPAVLVWRAAP